MSRVVLDRLGSALGASRTDPVDAEAAARVLLAALAEPGDGVLGELVAVLGPVPTADSLLAPADVAGLAGRLHDAGSRLDAGQLAAGARRWMPRLDVAAIERSIGQAARVGARLLLPGDPSWPAGLDDLGVHAPLLLWVRGDPTALTARAPSVAIVGARAATGYGEHMTAELAAGISDRGLSVVSGGAYGIDGAAHRAVLGGGGTTIAYLAGGVDRFYPLGHEHLLTRVVETGAVASEVPCGSAPTKWRFLQRNRLIAAASAATVVVEAGRRSGSLNTAGHAASLGRPLGAVPGPVTSPASAGCHRLLREYDAVCVTDAEQVVELVQADLGIDTAAGRPELPDVSRVLDALSVRVAREVGELASRSGLEARHVMGVLASLEVAGRAACRPDGWVLRRG